jgi:copper chaperone CopZ
MSLLAHEVPGRLRFVVSRLRRDPRAAALYRRDLRAVPGVHAVRVSVVTGSVTVLHDGRRQTRDEVVGHVNREAPGTFVTVRQMPAVTHDVPGLIADALAKRIVEMVVRVAVAGLI